jgi:hypothetical protein
VSDPEKLLHKRKEKTVQSFSFLDKNLSLPKDGLKSIDDLDFDLKFEQTLFRSRSESKLNEIIFDEKKFQSLIPTVPIQTIPIQIVPAQTVQIAQNPPRAMAARFSPLALPAQLHDLPQNYNQRIRSFDAEENTSAQRHLDWFNDFVDLEEVDHEDAKLRLFAQSLSGEVRKWFKSLPAVSILNFASFETLFLARWGDKKNPLQLLTQYNNIKRSPNETVQEFSTRFMKVYNSIPTEVKPPPGAAQLRYVDSFDSDFALLLRERRSNTLDDMMSDAIEVEVNLMASGKIKHNPDRDVKKVQGEAQPSTSQSSDEKFDLMMKTMERLMERMSLENKPATRDQTDFQPRNQNFRRAPVPQIRQRDQRNQGDQQIKPPFQNNYVNEDFDQTIEDNMHCCDDTETNVFLTKEEHDQFMDANDKFMQDNDDMLSLETKEFRKGYHNAIMQLQKQYNLRSKKVPANLPKENPTRELQINTPSSSQPKKDNSTKDAMEKGKSKEEPPKKIPEVRKEAVIKEVEKAPSPFNFESEMAKIKIYVPFNELIKNGEYRNQIIKMLKMEEAPDTLNVQDDHPAILFGPRVEESGDVDDVPPFYVSLKIHDMTLHNAMLDSGASHNLMPKVVMDELGLDITRPYKDLFSFDSRKVKCLGLIKDLVVSLSQIPSKNLIMDVVVVDIPPKFGMLLSRSWAAKLKGTLQMDMSYATIPVFGQERRLYREVLLKYMVSRKTQPNNHPIYSVDTEVGSSIFYNDLSFEEGEPTTVMAIKDKTDHQTEEITNQQNNAEDEMWNMSFDGAASREGAGVGVWINPPKIGTKLCSYKISFDCTNNMAEYEALILGLKTLKELGARRIVVHGDSELVINQVKGIYQSKHPRLRAYRNLVLDLLEEFS